MLEDVWGETNLVEDFPFHMSTFVASGFKILMVERSLRHLLFGGPPRGKTDNRSKWKC